MSDSDILKDISDDLRYYIKETVANSVYKNADDPTPGGGGGGGAFIVNRTGEGMDTLDKTAGEIMSAIESGMFVYIVYPGEAEGEYDAETLSGFGINTVMGGYYFTVPSFVNFVAATADDYPVMG